MAGAPVFASGFQPMSCLSEFRSIYHEFVWNWLVGSSVAVCNCICESEVLASSLDLPAAACCPGRTAPFFSRRCALGGPTAWRALPSSQRRDMAASRPAPFRRKRVGRKGGGGLGASWSSSCCLFDDDAYASSLLVCCGSGINCAARQWVHVDARSTTRSIVRVSMVRVCVSTRPDSTRH